MKLTGGASRPQRGNPLYKHAPLVLLSLGQLVSSSPLSSHLSPRNDVFQLSIPPSASGASISHVSSFSSFSFEPAFWYEFFGNATLPNRLTFDLLSQMVERGGQPVIRPGGITMDSMIFDPSAGDPVRTTNPQGGVYRTTVGPAYYQSWSNFPEGTKFVSTLNFGNNSLDIARDMALASVEYQNDKILFFELGNEPTNYPRTRWGNSTEAYVAQWKNFTGQIDAAVNSSLSEKGEPELSSRRWWASSATTDKTGLGVRPADIIPAGIDSAQQVAEYSIHSYAFATCDPARAARATIPNILNHTSLVHYADVEIYPSAKAAIDAGQPWAIGEFNSIACSGKQNVSDTFSQALWVVDTQLIYAVRNASSVYLHQGATLVFQSDQQENTSGDNGTPGFSTYAFVYPRTTSKRGPARALPSFISLLFLTEAIASSDVRVRALETPSGINPESFSGYAFYEAGSDRLSKIALLNMKPYYSNSTSSDDYTISFDISEHINSSNNGCPARLKRMTAPHVDEKDTKKATWAGQSFEQGSPAGDLDIEQIGADGLVNVRGSEAVLIFFDDTDVYGL